MQWMHRKGYSAEMLARVDAMARSQVVQLEFGGHIRVAADARSLRGAQQLYGGPMPGDGEGEFNYPYGLALMDDGSVLVSEFGASRVQRIDPATGARLGAWGRPGRGTGELACPWGVASIGDIAYVLDSMNHRVAAFRPTPVRGSAQRP